MVAESIRASPRARSEVRAAAGVVAGFALLALVNAGAIAVTVPFPAAGLGLRVAHHVFDAAETLGLGALVALAVFAGGAFVRIARLPRWATAVAAALAAIAVVERSIGEPLERAASHALGGRLEWALFGGSLALLGVGVPAALWIATRLSERPRFRILLIGIGVSGMLADRVWLPDDYAAVHCVVAWGAVLVAGAGLAPLAEDAGRALIRSRCGRAALSALGLFAIVGVAWPPSNEVRFELFRQPCAIAPWALATALWHAPRLHAPTPLPPSPWNEDRSREPPVPPTTPRLLPPDAVVVLLTIDALRADVVNDSANDALLPTIARLKREGIVFTHASAPGTQTAVSLGTLFSGLYFSEQRWTDHGVGGARYLYPADDPAPRFPRLLSDHGVATANEVGLFFLSNEFGVAAGFREEKIVSRGRAASSGELVDAVLDRLGRASAGSPLFLFTHLMDPHWPYDRGRKEGTDYERYLSEVAVADAAVGRVVDALSRGFGDRWALFLTADHGEAFGEHQTVGHSKTLYEELLHVPLLARSPLFRPRTIDERVGLVDLGPTILDLFGVETPATFNGQSLVPLLGGGTTAHLTRPLLAEGRLRRALTRPDGLKVIEDPRRKVIEVYDLSADPAETQNLFDADPARADAALAELRAFFAVHTRRDGGYETPYKP